MSPGQFFTSSIQRKILSGYVVVMILGAAIAVIAFYQLNLIRAYSQQISPNGVQMEALQSYALSLSSLNANLEKFFVIGGGQFQEAVLADLENLTNSLAVIDNTVTPELRPLYARLETVTRQFGQEIAGLVQPGTLNALSSRAQNQEIISVYSQLDAATLLHQELFKQTSNQIQEAASQQDSLTINVIFQLTVLGAFVAVVVIFVSVFLMRSVSVPLRNLTMVAQQIEQGNLEAQAAVTTQDEVGQLAKTFNRMTAQLKDTLEGLENQIAVRTERLETVVSLGEQLTAILDMNQLLQQLVDQVKTRFQYYHAHIYMLDNRRENLVVQAGSGEAGLALKNAGHTIPLNAVTSLVARAARTGQIVQVDNVRKSPDWLPNPLLPNTYSEMAIPIMIEDTVMGVLDVQQDKIGGLDESDASVLRFLASQVAVAIKNAQLFAQVETSLVQARAVQQQYLEQSWDLHQVTRKNSGRAQFSVGESTLLPEELVAAARRKSTELAEPTVVELPQDSGATLSPVQALVAPLRLRGVTIGNLQLHDADKDRVWSETDLALITAVVDQVVQAAENLRLLDDTQERASRERLIGQISDKLRRAPDMDSLLKIGVEELARALGPARTFVKMGSAEDLVGPSAPQKASITSVPLSADYQPVAANGRGDKV
jgi:GAF domain-containing protein/HAMP domain-containing protein